MASGEMTEEEFTELPDHRLQVDGAHAAPGALIYRLHGLAAYVGDPLRRSCGGVDALSISAFGPKLTPVWGRFYRSRHELVFVFRNGKEAHLNNIQLGRFGRNRTNVWTYPGVNGFARKGSEEPSRFTRR